ncbi:MAG: ribosome maturation factor RimM [Clostridiales bacterium]|nr:ribosome maturation factor RimM [Clostridiales bacterium]
MEYIEIGQIVNTQGLKGEVKVMPFTDDINRFDDLKKIYVEINSNKELLNIEKVRYVKNMVILKFKGKDRIEDIEKYKGKYIFIDETDKLDLPEDTFYISDLIGLDVIDNSNNNSIGKIVDIFSTGSNDVYVVKSEDGKEILLPAIKQVINNIDLINKKVIVNLIEGLL